MDPKKIAAAAAAALVVGIVIEVVKPGEVTARQSEYVMPDCGPDEKEVDCKFIHPDTGEPVWLGCVSWPAKAAVGTQCIAAPPSIILGSKLEKRGGQFVEVDKRGAVKAERKKDDPPRSKGK